jgi:hypothetical protein
MAYANTIYPAKAALKAALEAHTFPDTPPTITWGAPTEKEDVTYDMIYLGPVNDQPAEDTFLVLGGVRVDETYRLTVMVDVYRYGDDEQATELRAWQLHDGVLSVLDADHTIGGTVNRITGFRVRQSNPVPQPSQWRSQILIEVAVVGFVSLP